MKSTLQKLLLPLGWLYGGLMSLRNLAYDRGWLNIYTAPVSVISIGNLSFGGTGKTPMAEYLIRQLLAQGRQPAYLSRGYGRQSKGYRLVEPQSDQVSTVGDEALQLALRFPGIAVAVCEDRAAGLQRLLAERSVDTVILDDAMQHRRVARNLNIVMIDARHLPTRDAVLPAGSLREPLRGLKRADLLVINRVTSASEIRLIEQALNIFGKPMTFCRPQMQGMQAFGSDEHLPMSALAGQKVVAFSGIGNHPFFVEQLRQAGAIIVTDKAFRDHHPYTEKELLALEAQCVQDAILLTTEKDYCRLRSLRTGSPWYYVPIELEWWQGAERIAQFI